MNPLKPDADATLSKEETERYARHLMLPEVGMAGQKRLKNASILLIGSGGLGSPLAMYLAAAGIGKLGIVDQDKVDHSNLQRQIIHGTEDVGRPKIDSARESIHAINPHVEVETYSTFIKSHNALELIAPYDLVIDGTDNFATRYCVNDACVLLGKPNVYGSIFRFEGQASLFWAKEGPCYRCLYPEPPPPGSVPSCAEGGVLGVLPGIVGLIQATEAIKLIVGEGEPLIGRLLLFNALEMRFKELKLRKDPACPICGTNPSITELIDYDEFCGVPQEEPPAPAPGLEVDVLQLKKEMDANLPLIVLDVRETYEQDIARLDNTLDIPMAQVPTRLAEIDPNAHIAVLCRSGQRSANVQVFLIKQGYKNVRNITGGILAWADHNDPSMPKY